MHNILLESVMAADSYLEKVTEFEKKLQFDPFTYQHSLNVANLAVQLLNFSAHDLEEENIYYSGLFHDVGKCLVPQELLQKEARLTSDEFSQLKEHAKLGFRILQEHRFPADILFSALLHHEKYDGSGYPIGFVEKEIPAAARIVSICDVFDALTSDRPYRAAYTDHEALQIMEYSHSQFDPELLELFLTKYRERKLLKHRVYTLK